MSRRRAVRPAPPRTASRSSRASLSFFALAPIALIAVFALGCPAKQPVEPPPLPGPSATATLSAAQVTQTAIAAASHTAEAQATSDSASAQATRTAIGVAAVKKRSAYTVVRGNTLWSIARRKLHDSFLWPLIHDANRDQIADPHVIEVGQKLTLPARWSDADKQRAHEAAYAAPSSADLRRQRKVGS